MHLDMAFSDPAYGLSLLGLLLSVAGGYWGNRLNLAVGARGVILVGSILLFLPSALYALLGTSCYVFGGCP